MKPGYYDPCFRLQVAVFEEVYDYVVNQKRFGQWGLIEETEEEIRSRYNDDEFVKGELEFISNQNQATIELESVANWWEKRRKTGDMYLPEAYEDDSSDSFCLADKEIDDNFAKAIKHLDFLWY